MNDTWRKSSYSNSFSNCVEVAWAKSSHSCANQNCVEVGGHDDTVLVRDSKNPDGPVLAFTRSEWAAFLAAVKRDELGPAT